MDQASPEHPEDYSIPLTFENMENLDNRAILLQTEKMSESFPERQQFDIRFHNLEFFEI